MNGNLSAFREHFRRRGAAYLVLILSLIPTVLAYRRLKERIGRPISYFIGESHPDFC